jgi:hypothetical protein
MKRAVRIAAFLGMVYWSGWSLSVSKHPTGTKQATRSLSSRPTNFHNSVLTNHCPHRTLSLLFSFKCDPAEN